MLGSHMWTVALGKPEEGYFNNSASKLIQQEVDLPLLSRVRGSSAGNSSASGSSWALNCVDPTSQRLQQNVFSGGLQLCNSSLGLLALRIIALRVAHRIRIQGLANYVEPHNPLNRKCRQLQGTQ